MTNNNMKLPEKLKEMTFEPLYRTYPVLLTFEGGGRMSAWLTEAYMRLHPEAYFTPPGILAKMETCGMDADSFPPPTANPPYRIGKNE